MSDESIIEYYSRFSPLSDNCYKSTYSKFRMLLIKKAYA